MTNANPSGIQRWGEMRLLAPLARTFTVRRRVGLAYGTTMEGLANDYAIALDEEFGGPVDVPGIPNARLIIYEDRAGAQSPIGASAKTSSPFSWGIKLHARPLTTRSGFPLSRG